MVPYNKKNKDNERNRSSVWLTSAVPPRSVFLCTTKICFSMFDLPVHTRSRSTGRIVLQHEIIAEILPISKRGINNKKIKNKREIGLLPKKWRKFQGRLKELWFWALCEIFCQEKIVLDLEKIGLSSTKQEE